MIKRFIRLLTRGDHHRCETEEGRTLELALTGDDQGRFDGAILTCIALAEQGVPLGQAALEGAIRQLSRTARCKFHRPTVSYLRTREEAETAHEELLKAARHHRLLKDVQGSQRAFARAQAFFDSLTMMNEIAAVGGLAQQRAIQLLGTHLKVVSIAEHRRRQDDHERLEAHWTRTPEDVPAALPQPGSGGSRHARNDCDYSGVRRSCDAFGRDVLLCPQGQWFTCEWTIPGDSGKSLCTEHCARHGRIHVAVDRANPTGELSRTLALIVSSLVPDRARGLPDDVPSPWAPLARGERMLYAGQMPALLVVANERVKTGNDIGAIVNDLHLEIAGARGATPAKRGVAGSTVLIDRPEIERGDIGEADTAVEVALARLAGTAIHHAIEFVFCGRGYLGNPEIYLQPAVRAWIESVYERHPEVLCLLAPRALSIFLCALGIGRRDPGEQKVNLQTDEITQAYQQAFAAILSSEGDGATIASWSRPLLHELAYSVAQNLFDAQWPRRKHYVVFWPNSE